jgi:hypothetical protein
MFFVELKPAPNRKDIYNVKYLQLCSKLNRPSTKETLLNVQTVKDMDTQETIAISNSDASDVPVVTRKSSVNVKKDRVIFDVSSMVEIIPRITRDKWSTSIYKRKHTHLSVQKSTLLQHN